MKGASAIKPFGLRLPPDLKGWLEKRAEDNGRSQNGEIVVILKQEKERCEQQQAAA